MIKARITLFLEIDIDDENTDVQESFVKESLRQIVENILKSIQDQR